MSLLKIDNLSTEDQAIDLVITGFLGEEEKIIV